MDKVFYKSEYNWVVRVLLSSETLDQMSVSRNLFKRLVKKWEKTDVVIDFDSFYKIERIVSLKIRKKTGSFDYHS